MKGGKERRTEEQRKMNYEKCRERENQETREENWWLRMKLKRRKNQRGKQKRGHKMLMNLKETKVTVLHGEGETSQE